MQLEISKLSKLSQFQINTVCFLSFVVPKHVCIYDVNVKLPRQTQVINGREKEVMADYGHQENMFSVYHIYI